ncbi:MAG: transporter [Bacteroidaceae bacterium]|nr:transporter [Bacteroidaceae bacterium]
MKNFKTLFTLHILLMVFSLGSLCSKMAAGQSFLSFKFCLFYGGLIAALGIYAIGWQQVIKKLDLTVAYANKAVTVFWGIVWGKVFFDEPITVKKLIGAAIVISGVVLYSFADGKEKTHE